MDWRVTLADADIDQQEISAVSAVLASRWLSAGAVTEAFEAECARALGVAAAVAVSSGTGALHLAALALELGPGDEVIMPSLSFVASAATVALSGATPVFAEVRAADDLTVDPADVARRITSRTRAIVAMHYAGYSADMPALLALARRHGLALIEDAAHAMLVRSPDGMLGTLGDLGIFSFFATKNLTTGEGGLVVARDRALLQRIRARRSHCMTATSWDKQQGRPSTYDVDGLGLNYRPTEMTSALGRVQLAKQAADRSWRRALTERYHRQLREVDGLELPFSERAEDCAYHLMPVVLPGDCDRAAVQRYLKTRGIQSSIHYPPTHLFSWYRARYGYGPGSLPITENLAERELTLPLHGRMTEEHVDLVARVLGEAVAAQPARAA